MSFYPESFLSKAEKIVKRRTLSTFPAFFLVLLVITLANCNGFCLASTSYRQSFKESEINPSPTKLTSFSNALDVREYHKTKKELPKIQKFSQRFTFSWVKEIMQIGNKKVLELKDVWKLPLQQQMKTRSTTFQELLEKEKEKASSNTPRNDSDNNILKEFWRSPIIRAIFYMYKQDFYNSALIRFVNTMIQFLPSLIVARILRNLGKNPVSFTSSNFMQVIFQQFQKNTSFQLSILLFLCLTLKTVIENQYFDMVTNLGAQIRGTLSAAIYQKSLRLGMNSRQNSTLGEIVNYMQIDTARLEYVAASIHTVWDGLFQIIGYTTLLLFFLGPSVLAGIAAMLLIIPLNGYFLSKLSQARESNLKYTDIRVKLTNEIFQGIRAIKSYNWERPFLEKLQSARERELQLLKTAANSRAVLIAALGAAPSFVAVFSLTTFALLGNKVDPTNVFTSLALFNQLRFPLTFFPLLLNTLAEGRISLRRLNKFLLQEEVQDYVQKDYRSAGKDASFSSDTVTDSYRKVDSPAIYVRNATFSWSSDPMTAPPSLQPKEQKKDQKSPHTLEKDLGFFATDQRPMQPSRGILANVSLSIQPGELVAVIGPIGSGKSTLLNALLGELTKQEGQVVVQGEVAYVPQISWIPNESLRNAILFGKPMNWRNYRKAIRVSNLNKDLELLTHGDLTEIGEKGINLSGGQKQRISIARAVYQDADVYLFDDPLSALDSQVGQKVFQDCIQTALRGKTRILVTHKLNILAEVDKIVLMEVENSEQGSICKVLDQGNLWQLILRGHDLSRYVKKTSEETTEEKDETEPTAGEGKIDPKADEDIAARLVLDDAAAESEAESVVSPSTDATSLPIDTLNIALPEVLPTASVSTAKPKTSVTSLLPDSLEEDEEDQPFAPNAKTSSAAQLKQMTLEERGDGAVKFEYYKRYILEAKKPLLLVFILVSYFLANGSQVLQQYIVAAWTNDINYRKRPLAAYLVGVAAMALAVGGFNYVRAYLSALVGASTSKAMHNQMIRRMLHAPLNYFESTPIGRLLQRFSKDLDQIDNQLPNSLGQLVASSLQIMSSMAAICTVTPSFSLYMISIFLIYYQITNYYRPVARELKRLDSMSRSPIYSHFSETLNGLSVIRSYHRSSLYRTMNEAKLDDNLAAYFALKSIDRWLSFRLETLANIVVLFASVLAAFTGSRAGAAGLSINNALGITGLLNWAVRNAAEAESLMNSVERVYYTIDETPQERPVEMPHYPSEIVTYRPDVPPTYSSPAGVLSSSEDVLGPSEGIKHHPLATRAQIGVTSRYSSDPELLSSGWPWKGELLFQNVSMKYRDDFDNVLKGVDLHIQPGEKIGIVGRTGSGKSSLFRGLLRLNELEAGNIFLDQVDISQIGLNTLRSRISIIPQDPILFSGSIRMNIDPFHQSSDEEIWQALYKSKLFYLVKSLPGQLDYLLSENGDDFSSGQKQLLCLTRALIRKSKILLLDEATSSVDYSTDAMIQQTIQQEFTHPSQGTTVLTIAHRLSTVMNADKILVMENGRVKEFDSPGRLLLDPQSLFYQLVLAEQNEAQGGGGGELMGRKKKNSSSSNQKKEKENMRRRGDLRSLQEEKEEGGGSDFDQRAGDLDDHELLSENFPLSDDVRDSLFPETIIKEEEDQGDRMSSMTSRYYSDSDPSIDLPSSPTMEQQTSEAPIVSSSDGIDDAALSSDYSGDSPALKEGARIGDSQSFQEMEGGGLPVISPDQLDENEV